MTHDEVAHLIADYLAGRPVDADRLKEASARWQAVAGKGQFVRALVASTPLPAAAAPGTTNVVKLAPIRLRRRQARLEVLERTPAVTEMAAGWMSSGQTGLRIELTHPDLGAKVVLLAEPAGATDARLALLGVDAAEDAAIELVIESAGAITSLPVARFTDMRITAGETTVSARFADGLRVVVELSLAPVSS